MRSASSLPRLDDVIESFDELQSSPSSRRTTYRSSGKRGDTLRSTLQRGNPPLLGGCFPRQFLPSCTIGGVNLKNLPGIRDESNFAIGSDYRRRPITALASKGFWNGVSELKDVLATPRNPLSSDRQETAKFYIKESSTLRLPLKTEKLLEKLHEEGFDDNFFEDITTLHQRQGMLFQRCCEQLKDIYQTESEDMMNGKDEINVSVPYLRPSDNKRSSSHDASYVTSTPKPHVSKSASDKDHIPRHQRDAKKNANSNHSQFETNSNQKIVNDNFIHSPSSTLGRSVYTKGPKNRNDNSPTMVPPADSSKVSPFGEVDMADIEELYTEILYAILNPVGCDAPTQQEQMSMIEHLRRAFRVMPNKHLKLFDIASTTEKPQKKLNISVLSAKNLAGKDNLASSLEVEVSKGDPFVTCFLKSRPYDVKNSNTQPPNLNPVWKENFTLKLVDSCGNVGYGGMQHDHLHVDVWNYLIDETPKEKLRKLSKVKDPKGLKQFVYDLTDSKGGNSFNSETNSKHKLIGSVEIPLSDIPAAGLDKWWILEKMDTKGIKRIRGQINVVLQISTSDKDSSIVLEEHRRLLKILLTHELLNTNAEQFQWKDDFSKEALLILSQHAIQGRMNRFQTAMIRWLVYCEIHNILPLDYRVFTPILDKIRSHVLEKSMQEPADTNLMHFKLSVEKFIHQCVNFVRKHRYYLGNNYTKYIVQLESILKCLHILHCFKWRTKDDIILRVEDAIVKSVREWYNYVSTNIICLKSNKRGQLSTATTSSSSSCSSGSEEHHDRNRLIASQIRKLTKLAHLMTSDIQASIKQYKELFRETLNINYVELAFKEFENNLCLVSKDLVLEACNRMITNPNKNKTECNPSNLPEGTLKNQNLAANMFDNIVVVPEYEFRVGTRLFELYLALQSFHALANDILPHPCVITGSSTMDAMSTSTNSTLSDTNSNGSTYSHHCLSNYYLWFLKGVSKWLDIALLKAIKRIFKAVALDDLVSPVDELVQHTSSAVDIRLVFGQIRTFWKQLSWPDAETAYVFISRILDDLCKAAIFYGDRMCQKVEQCHNKTIQRNLNGIQDDNLHFTLQQCHALNNIVFILQSVHSFPSELGKDGIIAKIEESNGSLVADACRNTIDVLVKNALEDVDNQILQVLKRLSGGMYPKIIEILSATDESIQNLATNQQVIKDLIAYLDTNLIFLKTNLVKENFDRVLSVIWAATSASISTVINDGIANKKSVLYFSNLQQTLTILLNFFFDQSVPQNDATLDSIQQSLTLYSCNVSDLIESYYNRRYMDQRLLSATSTYPIGSITLRALIDRSHLRIEVLNARHLKPSHIQRRQYGEDILDSSKTSTFSRNHNLRRSYAFGEMKGSSKFTTNENIYHNGNQNVRNNGAPNGNMRIFEAEDKIARIRDRFDEMRSTLLEETALMQRNHSSNGNRSQSCNPYVSIRLVPDIDGTQFRLNGVPKVKTKIQERTLFPLFDETFEMVLPEGSNLQSTYLLLTVKDRCIMGEGLFLGESLLPLKNIQRNSTNISLQDVPQIQLALCRPSKNHEDILFALQTRLSTNTVSSSSKEKRRRRCSSTPPNATQNVAITTTSHQRYVHNNNESRNDVNRLSSNPSLQTKETHLAMINRRENSQASTNGPAREFLRKERRKRLF